MNATLYAVAADLVLVVHLAFIVFVVGGGLFALRWPRAAWVHLPAALWGVVVEAFGWVCPLTPLENALRAQAVRATQAVQAVDAAGAAGADGGAGSIGAPYTGDFIAHYLLPLIYPAALTRELQWLLAALVVAINLLIYRAVWRRRGKSDRSRGQSR